MIIGTKEISYEEIIDIALNNIEELIPYIENLVPPIVRHVTEIVNNQKYYVAIMLRKNSNLDYYTLYRVCNTILDGVDIFGYTTSFTDIKEILSKCSISYMIKKLYAKEIGVYEK